MKRDARGRWTSWAHQLLELRLQTKTAVEIAKECEKTHAMRRHRATHAGPQGEAAARATAVVIGQLHRGVKDSPHQALMVAMRCIGIDPEDWFDEPKATAVAAESARLKKSPPSAA